MSQNRIFLKSAQQKSRENPIETGFSRLYLTFDGDYSLTIRILRQSLSFVCVTLYNLYDNDWVHSGGSSHILSAMPAAAVSAFILFMVVMTAMNIGIIAKASIQKCMDRRIRIALRTTIELDARISQCDLRPAANAAADQGIYPTLHQKPCQRTVTAASSIDYFCLHDFAIGNFIYFEPLRMAKVLKNLSIFKCYRNFHHTCFLSFYWLIFPVTLRHSPAAVTTSNLFLPTTDTIISARNDQLSAMH